MSIELGIGIQKTFRLVSLGCRVNQYEVQAFRDQLTLIGLVEEFDEDTPADICIVNTCAVTHTAERSGKSLIRQLIKKNPSSKIVITGCLSEVDKEVIDRLERDFLIVSNKEKSRLVEKLFPEITHIPEFAIHTFKGYQRAFIKVQDGCNSFCSYCIIPYLRGRSVSRLTKDIIKEIQQVVQDGFKEVVIAGINVGDFNDGEYDLAGLLCQIDQIDGLKRIRVSSIDPDDVQDSLQRALLDCRHTSPSSHLVLQSGSNSILKRMNRKYNKADYLACVDKLREKDDTYSFSTDVIVGFPGETDQDFEDTIKIIERVGFIKVHIFPYSPRKRTKAYDFEGRVDHKVVSERKKHLFEIARNVSIREMNKRLGQVSQVLVEQIIGNQAKGHSLYFEPVTFTHSEKDRVSVNSIVNVDITGVNDKGLIGTIRI